MTPSTDLRSLIDALDEIGDLTHIRREVDGDLEPGAITRRSYEIQAPTPLFESIQGATPGFRILGAPAALSSRADMRYARIALSLGMPADTRGEDIVEALAAARAKPLLPPVHVDPASAPCRQNILRGDDANLNRFPIPFAHDGDGGRYANTWGTVILKTPDGRWVNWAITRIMKVDGKRLTGLVVPSQHIGQIWQEWVDIGKPMPYALVQGPAPAASCVSGIPLPAGVDEADYVGALLGKALEVVPAVSVDLDVPASSEIVIEGHVSLERDCMEGPYGEYGGYIGHKSFLQPTFHVETITHRDNPIWPLVVAGRPTKPTPSGLWVSPPMPWCISARLNCRLNQSGSPKAPQSIGCSSLSPKTGVTNSRACPARNSRSAWARRSSRQTRWSGSRRCIWSTKTSIQPTWRT